jgi:hypothetical protein
VLSKKRVGLFDAKALKVDARKKARKNFTSAVVESEQEPPLLITSFMV